MKFLKLVSLLLAISLNLNSKDLIEINFEDLSIEEFIKISSKVLDKSILFSEKIEGNVNFTSDKKLSKYEVFSILDSVLDEKGYYLKDEGKFLKLAKKDDKNSLQTRVISIKNLEAQNLHKILDEIISKRNYKENSQKPIINFENDSNSIIIISNEDEFNEINQIINSLDIEKAQVYVQAKIIDLNDEMLQRVGFSYGLFGGNVGSHNLMTFSSSLNGGSDSLSLVKDILGLKIPDIKSGLALGASLNLLKQNGALNVISEPTILALDNKESSIYVGEKISVQTSSSLSDGGTERTNYQREDVGLTLKVKPRVSSDTKLSLEINALLEGVKSKSVGAGDNPDTLKKEIKTTAILNNGESVIIGGLIETKSEQIEEKIPLLGDIPILGNVFKNDSNLNKKSNLVIIVTPYMIPKSKDISYVRNELSKLKELEDMFLQENIEDKLAIKKSKNLKKEQENLLLNSLEEKKKKEKSKEVKQSNENRFESFYNSVNPN